MTLNKFNLTGKTALITGAAGLLGKEHAAALLECGAAVVLTDISEPALRAAKSDLSLEYAADRIVTLVVDVSQLQAIQFAAQKLSRQGISIEILAKKAAIVPTVKGDQGR